MPRWLMLRAEPSRAELGELPEVTPVPSPAFLSPVSKTSLGSRGLSGRGHTSSRDAHLGRGKSAGAAEAGAFQSHSSAFPAALPLPVGKDRQGNAGCEMLLLQLKAALHSCWGRGAPGTAAGRIWGCCPSQRCFFEEQSFSFLGRAGAELPLPAQLLSRGAACFTHAFLFPSCWKFDPTKTLPQQLIASPAVT